MTRKKALEILKEMEELFPDAKSELMNWETPFQFLCCIILSAQTTDKQVNKVTAQLFEKYPDARTMSRAQPEEIAKLIKGINYFNNKSKHLVGTATQIWHEYKGQVPRTVKELINLPGVGNKTANVFLNDLDEANEGIGADTHIMRISQRLGFTKAKTPEKIAADLQKIYPRNYWHRVNTLFVLYGRYYCKARINPAKSECIFKDICSWCGSKV